MKKNDSLKKHHFWILFGLVPLFVMIAVLVVTSSVGGAITAKTAEIETVQKSVAGKTPKPEKLVEILNKGIEEVKKQKTSLWEKNWNLQAPLYTWPSSPQLKAFEKMNMKFGTKIPQGDDFAFAQFKLPEVYLAEYSYGEDPAARKPATRGMVTAVAPTEFRGGWQSILRHVTRNGWGAGDPTSDQIWLLLEDIWVQRSLLDAIRSINQQMATFTPAKYVRDNITVDDPAPKSTVRNPLRRRFESKTWAVELEVKNKGNDRILTGRLINQTNRLQLMGLGNTMVLNVWLDKGKDSRPFEFRIGGEFLPGAGAMKPDGTTPANVLEIVETLDHVIPASMTVAEIARVEQKFDTRTVPVRRIETMALGYTDARHAGSQLVPPKFLEPKEGEATTATPATGEPGGLSDPSGGIQPGMGTTGPPGYGGAAAGPVARLGGASLDSVTDANKNRYVAVTPQVRRMPVGIVILVDQSLIQDALLAFANTPLRFQVTQVTWKRFRGSLSGTNVGGTGVYGEGGIVESGGGDLGAELRGGYGIGGSDSPIPGGIGPMPGGIGPMPGVGPGGSPGQPPYGGSGGYSNPYSPYGPSGGMTTVSESQLTSGLVELSIYGVVSLYEKYSPEQEAADEKAAKDKEEQEAKDKEKGKDPKTDADPKKGTEPTEPKDPMPSDPKGPKMRRRPSRRA